MSNRSNSPTVLRDGCLNFSGGVDEAQEPSEIAQNQIARGLNCTCRNGRTAPRPGYRKRNLVFGIEVQGAFESARFQEAYFYDGNGRPSLLSSHGGRQFRIDLRNFNVTEITPVLSGSTLTVTNAVVIPAVGATVVVTVVDSTGMTLQKPNVAIGAYDFLLTEVTNSGQIVVQNTTLANVAAVIAVGAAVRFDKFDYNNPKLHRNWSTQTENYWVLQDNKSYPIFYDGTKTSRSNPAKMMVPIGNVMVYAEGRLMVALPNRQSYQVGDLIFGPSGTPAAGYRDSILYFKENMYLNEGGNFVARVFGAPSNAGNILAMKANAQVDTQLGQGPVSVGTPNVSFSVRLPYDRTIWKNLANALQTTIPIIGPTGNDSTILVNTDIWYRALDGIRSYVFGMREMQGLGNTPVSKEMNPTLSADTQSLLEHGSGVLFNNYAIWTLSPQQSSSGVFHRGLIVMDFEKTSALKNKEGPAWDGIWTGLRVLKILTGLVNGESRCFMYVLNEDSVIELWELTKIDKTDTDGDGVSTPITWEVDLRSMNFGNSDFFKRLIAGRIIFTNLVGTLTGFVEYRNDESPCWNSWATINECAKDKDCGPFNEDEEDGDATCDGPRIYNPQTRYPVRLTEPPDEFDTITHHKKRTGYEFQPRLRLTGYANLKQLRLYCEDEPENLGIE